jgi:hypothetical protein
MKSSSLEHLALQAYHLDTNSDTKANLVDSQKVMTSEPDELYEGGSRRKDKKQDKGILCLKTKKKFQN